MQARPPLLALNEIWRHLDPRRSFSEEMVQQDCPDDAVLGLDTPTFFVSLQVGGHQRSSKLHSTQGSIAATGSHR